MNADQAYETYFKSIKPKVQTLLKQYGKLQHEVQMECYETVKGEMSNFIKCMKPETERIFYLRKLFDYRMAVNQKEVINCFQQQEKTSQNYKQCQQNGEKQLDFMIKDFRLQMKS